MSAALAAWPSPGPLKGVKSRTKVVVRAPAGEVEVEGGRACGFSGVSVTGESRVLAVGAGGHAVARAVLLKQRPLSGELSHVAGLVMVHLGPHLAGAAASCEAHSAAIAAALRAKPHIVVLDEALAAGSQTWIQVFDAVLHSEAARVFKGALIVCVAVEPAGPPCHGCSERWSQAPEPDSVVSQEEIKSRLRLLENVQAEAAIVPMEAHARKGDREAIDFGVAALMEEARELSDYCFEEDVFEAAREEGDTVTFLTEIGAGGSRSLCGYICYRSYLAPRAELHVSRLAVPKSKRGRGLAKLLMHWIMGGAARAPKTEIEFVTLSALETAVSFYAKLGFVVAPSRKTLKDGDDPQTWMEIPNVSAVPEPSLSGTDAGTGTPPAPQGGASEPAREVAAPAGWQEGLVPTEMALRIVEIEKLLRNHRKKLSDEETDKLMDEVTAMQNELRFSTKEIAKRIKDIETQLQGGKKKKPLSHEKMEALETELDNLKSILAAMRIEIVI